jgi:hypothetical protein
MDIAAEEAADSRNAVPEAQGTQTIELDKSGEYVLMQKGTWHTAKTRGPCRMLFLTPGEGTQRRQI